MNELLETVKDYYANTLIVQYNRKPKADATVRKLVDLVYANMILTQILNGFTLESVSYQIYNTKTVGTDDNVQNAYNFTVIGSPKITADGIASGFSSGNYLKSNIPILNLNGKSFAIYTRINTGNFTQSPTNEVALYGNTEHNRYSPQFQLYKSGTSIWGAVGIDGGASWASVQINNISPALLENTYYYFKQVYNAQANTLTIGFSSDGVVWNEKTETLNSSSYWVEQIEIGADQNANFLTGSIDLKQFKIIVDGVEVYKAWQPPVVINRFTFGSKVNNVGGFYKFYYNGSGWLLSGENVTLDDYGIKHNDSAIEGDTICVTYTPYTAKGKQLDIIGQWVGVTKNYNINLRTKPLLAYPQYQRLEVGTTSDLQGGYSTYATFDTLEGGQLRYSDLQSVNNELSQQSYRIIIALKIIYNNINHIAGEIDEAIYNLFGGDVITIWTDHTLTYQYPPSYAEIMGVAKYKKVLPAPIGTKIKLQQIGV